ncbi:MAG: 4-hydroxy-tetrahydrodipicolinate synthase [Saprospiraceae bacterium]|nr:4-hydroxy-tetrahydrodipicolinate synthase [Saprospiraceae bacterium]
MRQIQLSGIGVALVTPFGVDGSIDFKALERLIEHTLQGGVDFLVSLGSTGETSLLSPQECRAVLDATISITQKRVPILAGLFGGNNTLEVTERIKGYNLTGIDALMVSNPAYVKPNQEGIFRHYMALASVSPLPILIYNVPSRSASNMKAETTLRLAEASEKFIGVKEASDDLMQIMQIIKNCPDDFSVLSGDDFLTLPILSVGGKGLISVIGNAYPKEYSMLVKAALNGDYITARYFNELLLDVHPLLYVEGNPTGIKSALSYMGICHKDVRLPMGPISHEVEEKLHQQMEIISNQMILEKD